jgi:hypothetical protein
LAQGLAEQLAMKFALVETSPSAPAAVAALEVMLVSGEREVQRLDTDQEDRRSFKLTLFYSRPHYEPEAIRRAILAARGHKRLTSTTLVVFSQ